MLLGLRKLKCFLNIPLFMSASFSLINSLYLFASIFVAFLGDCFLSGFLIYFFFFVFLIFFFRLPQTRTHNNHQQVSIFCSQISFCLLYLNHIFFIVFILVNKYNSLKRSLPLFLTFSFRSYFYFVCELSFLNIVNFL